MKAKTIVYSFPPPPPLHVPYSRSPLSTKNMDREEEEEEENDDNGDVHLRERAGLPPPPPPPPPLPPPPLFSCAEGVSFGGAATVNLSKVMQRRKRGLKFSERASERARGGERKSRGENRHLSNLGLRHCAARRWKARSPTLPNLKNGRRRPALFIIGAVILRFRSTGRRGRPAGPYFALI